MRSLPFAILTSLCLSVMPAQADIARGVPDRPIISSVTPSAPARKGATQVLTIVGKGFAEGLALEITSPAGQTQALSGKEIEARQETSFKVSVLLATNGVYSLVVRNTDGGVSDPFPLTIQPTGSAPAIERLSPDAAQKDSRPQPIKIIGRNFQAGLTVTVTDPTGEVTIIARSDIGTVMPTSFDLNLVLDRAGDYAILVTNPTKEQSNSVTLTVTQR